MIGRNHEWQVVVGVKALGPIIKVIYYYCLLCSGCSVEMSE